MRELDGSSVLIVGFGREGKSVLEHVRRTCPDMAVGIADSDDVSLMTLPAGVRTHSGKDYLASLDDYDIIVRSPGVRPDTPRLSEAAREGRVTSATNIFLDAAPGTVVGVTGTKGKSTTSSLIARMLDEVNDDVRLVGNIGVPALSSLPHADSETIFVMELSSQQLVDLRYSPSLAVVLSIYPEHLDFHGGFRSYQTAKRRIVAHQGVEDAAVGAADNELSAAIVRSSRARRKAFFSAHDHPEANVRVVDGDLVIKNGGHGSRRVMAVEEIPLHGPGNLSNVAAAMSTASLLHVPLSAMRRAVACFKSLPHRLEPAGEVDGIRFVNDSLATIPEAVVNAVEAFGGDVETLIVGGFDRGLDYSGLARYLLASDVRTLILLPESGRRIWEEVLRHRGSGDAPAKVEVSSLEEAVEEALRLTSKGKICLLSPGSASYGRFRDFSERGNRFKAAVRAAAS